MIESKLIYIILTLIAGIAVTFQGPINAALTKSTNVEFATLWAFLAGTIMILLYFLIKRIPFPTITELKQVPIYYYLGALTGLFYVITLIIVIPRLGIAKTTVLLILAQTIMALLIDRLGLFGLEVKLITTTKIMGVFLVLGGVYLVNR